MNEIEILCLGSGSSGNCYLLSNGKGEYIMVECGLPYKTIISKLDDYNIGIEQIKYLCVSHSHKDHSMSVDDLVCLNIPLFSPSLEGWRTEGPIYQRLTEWAKVCAFKVDHDVPCYAFIFMINGIESILFVTDTRYIESPYFKYKYTYIMIECNHIRKQLEAILNKAIQEGKKDKVYKLTRQAKYHLSLAGVKKILNSMNLSETKAIFLMHLSKECCNDDLIKKEVANKYKIRTFVCYREGRIN